MEPVKNAGKMSHGRTQGLTVELARRKGRAEAVLPRFLREPRLYDKRVDIVVFVGL